MSRVHTYIGTIDAPYADKPKHVHALVFGTDPHTPEFGYVVIPLTCFPREQREHLEDGMRIQGRYCSRSHRVRVTGTPLPRADEAIS